MSIMLDEVVEFGRYRDAMARWRTAKERANAAREALQSATFEEDSARRNAEGAGLRMRLAVLGLEKSPENVQFVTQMDRDAREESEQEERRAREREEKRRDATKNSVVLEKPRVAYDAQHVAAELPSAIGRYHQ